MFKKKETVGISDLAFYFPTSTISIKKLLEKRMSENADIADVLIRANKNLRQDGNEGSFVFPAPWEDPVTMGAESVRNLFKNNPDLSLSDLRYVTSATETAVDHSKPIASYLCGVLQRNNFQLPTNMLTSQVLHACAGGTIALFNTLNALSVSQDKAQGLVVSTDVARYQEKSSAELTQGAGAVSVLVEKDPKLLKIDLHSVGMFSSDVDDFFRPLPSKVPQVRGQYSMNCYLEAMEKSFIDLCRLKKQKLVSVLKETALTIFHVPFAAMADIAMLRLYSRIGDIGPDEIDHFILKEGFSKSLRAHRRCGNTYTVSFFLHLAVSLKDHFELRGDSIVGDKILCFSYGSGNAMLAFTAEILPGALEVIKSWPDDLLGERQDVDFDVYQDWLDERANFLMTELPSKAFYLSEVRSDGFRKYARNT